ncbi:membrane protein [Vibrio inusitatus NBRC 102082]|uniref:Membrane protein n=1 Tax=Vibrio inusitatus NBRC 102082 TaxID=1219070 RepID=A0A4Y3HQG8_9VIBR|nr:DUF2956 domain-containing protein [Vibrio inusitatus]GEA49399.1 membrane protein [Vibrio inusitatus NBRC 102082]
MKKNNTTISSETQQQAMQVAKSTQKPGQSKEQTKLIALGIEKGIAEYKKRQKQKSREADKLKKRSQKQKQSVSESITSDLAETETPSNSNKLPWVLLVISWIGFIAYVVLTAA